MLASEIIICRTPSLLPELLEVIHVIIHFVLVIVFIVELRLSILAQILHPHTVFRVHN